MKKARPLRRRKWRRSETEGVLDNGSSAMGLTGRCGPLILESIGALQIGRLLKVNKNRILAPRRRLIWSASVHCRDGSEVQVRSLGWRPEYPALMCADGSFRSNLERIERAPSASRFLTLTRSNEIPSLKGEAGTEPAETRFLPVQRSQARQSKAKRGIYRGTRIGQHERPSGANAVLRQIPGHLRAPPPL